MIRPGVRACSGCSNMSGVHIRSLYQKTTFILRWIYYDKSITIDECKEVKKLEKEYTRRDGLRQPPLIIGWGCRPRPELARGTIYLILDS